MIEKIKRLPVFIFVFSLVCGSFFACSNDDSFSSSSSLRLSFPVDTIRFDTVFTSMGSSTKQLKVYNGNKDAISISSVRLMSPQRSGFRLNVDGLSGDNISNIDILGKDSLYVFVEVTVDPLDKNSPMAISDSICFQFNGVTQYVRLEAIGQNVTLWYGKTIDQDTVLAAEKPFLIYDSLYIKKGATLRIEEGTAFYFHDGAGLSVAGTVIAKGSIENPIVMRGDRMDNLFEMPLLPYDRVPGQWMGLRFSSESFDNVFENVRIRNGIYGMIFDSSDPTRQKATLLNTVVQNTTKDGFVAVNCKIEAKNCLFNNSGGNTVRLIGGKYRFLHCDILNFLNPYWIKSRRSAFELNTQGVDVLGKPVQGSLIDGRFISTIVWGDAGREIIVGNSQNGLFMNYQFINCLLKANGTDDDNFINTVWNVDPLFRYIFYTTNEGVPLNGYFMYDFRLMQNSPARNRASRGFVMELPDDLNGKSRRSDETPDIGCFEF